MTEEQAKRPCNLTQTFDVYQSSGQVNVDADGNKTFTELRLFAGGFKTRREAVESLKHGGHEGDTYAIVKRVLTATVGPSVKKVLEIS